MEINVPGISSSSGIDTNKLIEDLLEAERIPINRLELDITESKQKIKIWDDLSSKLRDLQDSTKRLYGFQNPFAERLVSSSNESVLRASSQRGSDPASYELLVKQIAKSDRFLSDPVPFDFSVPTGNYVFKIADNSLSFTFEKGNLEDLIARINELDSAQLAARLYQVDSQTKEYRVLVESRKLGAQYKLSFENAANTFAKEIGLISDSTITRQPILSSDIYLISDNTASEQPAKKTMLRVKDGLNFDSGSISKIAIDLSPEALSKPEDYTIEFSYEFIDQQADSASVSENTQKASELETKPPNSQQGTEGIYKDIVIDGIHSNLFGEFEPIDQYPLLLNSENTPIHTFKFSDEDKKNGSVSLELKDLVSKDTLSLLVVSPLVGKELYFSNISLGKNKNSASRPKNLLEQASDAIVNFEGVDLKRPQNTIDDIIPGVTLDLVADSTEPVQLKIETNNDYIKESIIDFISMYNIVLQIINIYTENDEELLNNVSFESIQEREEYVSRLGVLSGNINLIRLESQLQSTITRRWTFPTAQEINSIQQVGISFRANSFNQSNNQQYLGLDEETLDEAINKSLDSLKALLGHDIDGDLVVDNGLAFTISGLLQPYLQANGIIYQSKQTLTGEIGRAESRIGRYEDGAARYEDSLRRDFGQMETIIEQLNNQSEVLDRLNSNGQ